jgi:hypothetical protein
MIWNNIRWLILISCFTRKNPKRLGRMVLESSIVEMMLISQISLLRLENPTNDEDSDEVGF